MMCVGEASFCRFLFLHLPLPRGEPGSTGKTTFINPEDCFTSRSNRNKGIVNLDRVHNWTRLSVESEWFMERGYGLSRYWPGSFPITGTADRHVMRELPLTPNIFSASRPWSSMLRCREALKSMLNDRLAMI